VVNGKFHALNERSKTFTLKVEPGHGPDERGRRDFRLFTLSSGHGTDDL